MVQTTVTTRTSTIVARPVRIVRSSPAAQTLQDVETVLGVERHEHNRQHAETEADDVKRAVEELENDFVERWHRTLSLIGLPRGAADYITPDRTAAS